MNLTERQREVLEFVQDFVHERDMAPSYEEIRAHFGFSSLNSVFKHLKQLESRGYIESPWNNRKRVLSVRKAGREGTVPRSLMLPLLGTVAAGRPIDAIEVPEGVEVPESLLSGGDCFALRVKGESMIEDGIHDGDMILVKSQATAEDGQTVVALIDNEATVKRFYRKGKQIELRPANSTMKPIKVKAGQHFEIRGIVVGLLRKY